MITLHYDEFMGELNQYQFRGNVNPQRIARDSFGAFLHHFPLLALPALNAAMGLAVATVWSQDQAAAAAAAPSLSATAALKLERFVDRCQLVVRLLHVNPQLPMADIKTGLVGKFISVKVSSTYVCMYVP